MRSIVGWYLIPAECWLALALLTPLVQAEGPPGLSSGAAAAQAAAPRPAAVPSTPSPRIAPRPFIPTRAGARSSTHLSGANQQSYAPGFFGGSSARASLSQLPRRAAIQPAPPQPMRGQIKPFETIYREPTISPYLNLYREEDDAEGAPNYHTFVRPYQDQIEANRRQQHEIQQLRGQLQGISTSIAGPQYGEATLPATGTRSRYMDTAQFYGGWRR